MRKIEIAPVASKRDRREFVDLSYRLHSADPNWVAPLRSEARELITPGKNPFFEHAEAVYLLAERDGRVVGRITAQVDRNLHAFQDNRWGQFGWFECEDDQEAADALLDAAAAWVKERGCDRIVGPFSFTTNDEGRHRACPPPRCLFGPGVGKPRLTTPPCGA
ncbi:MAG: hypothetical protein ACEQR8_02865 [Cypionkella sp.]